jgi:hypothetical protein
MMNSISAIVTAVTHPSKVVYSQSCAATQKLIKAFAIAAASAKNRA